MNEEKLIEKINSRIDELIKKIRLEEGPEELVRILKDAEPRFFTRKYVGSRDDLAEHFSEWEDELQEMFDDIDELIDEHQVWRDKADWFEIQGDLHNE